MLLIVRVKLNFLLVALTMLGVHSVGMSQTGEQALWSGLRSGELFVVMRHALAPGTGDPAGFELGDCTTQRNLSKRGREQAREIGESFAENGIPEASVFTSQWCRCRETAELMGLGPVKTLESLNSFFRDYGKRDSQTRQLQSWLGSRSSSEPLVLVTHQVNITALTQVYPSSGEMVFCRLGDDRQLEVVGRILGK